MFVGTMYNYGRPCSVMLNVNGIIVLWDCGGKSSPRFMGFNSFYLFESLLVVQPCLTLCDPCQAPLSMGILQARILEWVAIPFSRGSSRFFRDQTQVSGVSCIGKWIL